MSPPVRPSDVFVFAPKRIEFPLIRPHPQTDLSPRPFIFVESLLICCFSLLRTDGRAVRAGRRLTAVWRGARDRSCIFLRPTAAGVDSAPSRFASGAWLRSNNYVETSNTPARTKREELKEMEADKATPHVFWRTASRRMALVARLIARRETAEEQSAGVSLILALIKSSRAVRAHTGRGVGVGGVSR